MKRGEAMVELGEQIIEARTEANETWMIQGPSHPSTRAAQTRLRYLMANAAILFDPSHA